MRKKNLCHTTEQSLYLALQSLHSDGIEIRLEGEELTGMRAKYSLLMKEPDAWEGVCVRNPEGKLEEILFSRKEPS